MARRRSQLLGGTALPGTQSPTTRSKPNAGATVTDTIDPEKVVYMEAPEVFASGVNAGIVTNDVVLTFTRPRAGTIALGAEQVSVATLIPSAYVTLSIGTAKDLRTALTLVIDQYEKEFGEVQTAFARQHTTLPTS
jgi:hypothetical protein